MRDYQSKDYKQWRTKVLKRDGYHCQFPGCKRKGRIAHHIKKWADYPSLRFVVSNGVALCHSHHKKIWGKEEQFEQLFMRIVGEKKEPESGISDIELELLKRRFKRGP